METKTVWSFVCDSASVLPSSLGWIRKSRNSRLATKVSRDTYKLNELTNCYLTRTLCYLMQMVHSGAFEHVCSECFNVFPNSQLNNTRSLLITFESLKRPFTVQNFKDREWHYDLYKGVEWAKNETVGHFIERINRQVCRYNMCTKHTTAFKNEKLNSALKTKFCELVECLVLLSVSSNYEEDTGKYYSSPRAVSEKIPAQILASVASAIEDILFCE